MKFLDEFQLMRKDPIWGERTWLGKILFFSSLSFGIFIFITSIISTHYYKYLIREDGVIEYSSALCWFLGAIVIILILIFNHKIDRISTLCYVCLLIFFIACCGEEISWGQRIFGIQGPDMIISINKQHELNLHDIGHISIFSNIFFLIYLFVFFVYPYLVFKSVIFKQFVTKHKFPVVSYELVMIAMSVIVIWCIIGVRYGTLGFHPYSLFGYYTQMDDEIFEFLAAYTYLCFALLQMRRTFRLTRRCR